MTNDQILKQAIKKAVENGYKNFDWNKIDITVVPVNNVIFSHSFAKAFWKDEKIINWQTHLQKMVIKKKPLKYLSRFLENESNNSSRRLGNTY